MSDAPGQRALIEVASLRGQLTILHEAIGRIASRLDETIEHNRQERVHAEDERRASRRYALTTSIGAGAIVLTAVGMIVNNLA
jgi:hypothetical protein